MIATLFQFLFKYQWLVFEQGKFVFGASRSMWLTSAVVAVAALYALWTYRQVAALAGPRSRRAARHPRSRCSWSSCSPSCGRCCCSRSPCRSRTSSASCSTTRAACRWPTTTGSRAAPSSRRNWRKPDAPLLTALGKRFNLRVFRFSSSAERLQSTGDLTFKGTATRLGDALDRARSELSGLPVAGLVVVTDGSDNAERTIDASIAGLKAQGMPVFAVGVGKERLTRDVQVTRVETPARALKGSSLVLDVVVTQVGYAGRKVPLVVEDAGRIVSTQDVTLPGDGESQTVKVRLKTVRRRRRGCSSSRSRRSRTKKSR